MSSRHSEKPKEAKDVDLVSATDSELASLGLRVINGGRV